MLWSYPNFRERSVNAVEGFRGLPKAFVWKALLSSLWRAGFSPPFLLLHRIQAGMRGIHLFACTATGRQRSPRQTGATFRADFVRPRHWQQSERGHRCGYHHGPHARERPVVNRSYKRLPLHLRSALPFTERFG